MVLLIVFALVAAACSPSDDGTATLETSSTTQPVEQTVPTTQDTIPTTTTEPRVTRPYGGEAIVGEDQEPPTLNGFVPGGSVFIVSTIAQTYAAGVQEIDGFSLELVPELVTELPTVGNGGVTLNDSGTMTVKYTIRDEAVWEDGTPISGDDFQFTLDMILDPDLPIDKKWYEDIVESVAGPKTFEYTMARPNVVFELLFGEILPKHDVEGTDFITDWNDTRWVSSGPFKLKEWEKGAFITVERNDNYWKTDAETGQQLPYLDTVTFKFYPPDEVIEPFVDREVDVINLDWNIDDYETLQALAPRGARVDVLSGSTWEQLNFQFGPGRLTRNPNSCNSNYNMRLAVAQTIDKQILTDEIYAGLVEPLGSYVDVYQPSLSQGSWDQYTVDNVAAAKNFAKAVEAEGVECSVIFTTTRRDSRVVMSELFLNMFEASGIPFENQLEDSQLFLGATISRGEYDLSGWAWRSTPGLSGLVRIHDVFDPAAPPPTGSNYYRWGTEDSSVIDDASRRFAEVRVEMNSTADEEELVALINEAEDILADNLVIIPLYARPEAAAVWENEIAGFRHNPTLAGYMWNVESWYRADLAG